MVDLKKAARKPGGTPQNKPLAQAAKPVLKPQSPYLRVALGALLLLTIIVFSNALNNAFLDWDDNTYIKANKAIHEISGANIREIFSSFYMANYHPLTSLTYMLEYSIAGHENPFLYHLNNLIIHLLNIVILFFLIRRLTQKPWLALMVAALFALHPTRVESVSWISERKDVLYTFFYFLSLNSYLNSLDKPEKRLRYLGFTFLFFVGALLSKSAAVTLPVVLILLDYLRKRRFSAATFLEKLPFFALSLLFGYLALQSQQEAIRDLPHYSVMQRFFMLNHTVFKYIFLAFIPAGLSTLHPYPILENGNLPMLYYLSPLGNLAVLALVIWLSRRERIAAFGLLFFLVTISLVIQLIPVGGAIMAERYTYVPYIGLYVVACWYLLKGIEARKGLQSPLIAAFGIFLLVFAGMTWNRNKVWANDITLWDDAIAAYPTTAFTAYMDRGAAKQLQNDKQGAWEDYSKAILIKPDYHKALINRGLIRYDSANYTGALADFDKGIAARPEYNLGYLNRAVTKLALKDFAGALADLNKSNELKPDVIEVVFNLGTAKNGLKDYPGAIAAFKRVLELDPTYTNAYNKLGIVHLNMGDKEKACQYWTTGAGLGNQTCQTNLKNVCQSGKTN